MPSGGQNKKPTHPPKQSKGPPLSFAAPPTITAELRRHWDDIVLDLRDSGTVTRSDLVLLERSFGQLNNANRLQEKFDEALADPDLSPTDLAKYQNAVTSATASFLRLVLEVRRAVRTFTKQDADSDPFEATRQ